MRLARIGLVLMLLAGICGGLQAYPVDGYETTHIRRLQSAQLGHGGKLLPGALLGEAQVQAAPLVLSKWPVAHAELSLQLRDVLGENHAEYGVAVLDISDPAQPNYIAHNDTWQANVGSVGKLLVMAGLFNTLAELYPADNAARARLLRDTLVTADDWAVYDEHKIPVFDAGSGRILARQLRVGDVGNVYEYLDWMLSASNNGAANMIIQQLILLEQFGLEYPVSAGDSAAFLGASSPAALGRLYANAMKRAVRKLGLDESKIRQGSLFTGNGKRAVAGTTSYASPMQLLNVLVAIETGQFIDGWSSTVAKRLLYLTQRRIRYASHPVLNESAVYFKSGSLYRCRPEEGFVCRKYQGNLENRLASTAMVESPAGQPKLRYMVVVMSNVLRANSAIAHQTLALQVHRLVETANKQRLTEAGYSLPAKVLPPARREDAEGTEP